MKTADGGRARERDPAAARALEQGPENDIDLRRGDTLRRLTRGWRPALVGVTAALLAIAGLSLVFG